MIHTIESTQVTAQITVKDYWGTVIVEIDDSLSCEGASIHLNREGVIALIARLTDAQARIDEVPPVSRTPEEDPDAPL